MVKKATFLPAPPRRTKTRLIPGEAAVSCENEAGGFLTILLARIIHECRREAFEPEARRGFSQGARRAE
ncbi:MAG: hypothetical protein K0S58_1687 [Nitrospira sp.]|jgi:hypothetical protein|nr:hypothetical protein [Nitrospira sp.]